MAYKLTIPAPEKISTKDVTHHLTLTVKHLNDMDQAHDCKDGKRLVSRALMRAHILPFPLP